MTQTQNQGKTEESAHLSPTYQPIEDYAVIGDLHTVALVGKNGSIDWCCIPRFDSASVFGALLDINKGGFFRIAPPDTPGMGRKQLYIPETNILSDSLCLGLASSVHMGEDGQGGVRADFTLHAGQAVHFILESARETDRAPEPLSEREYQAAFHETITYWRHWVIQCRYQGRWREMVQRSALVLKLLTYAPTGAIVAAPTTSLPETIGGARNWDYRYTWLRDAAFSLYSLLTLGLSREAEAFMGWLDARCHELKENGALQPMYGIDGTHDLTEIALDHLEGYRQSKPVRIGNGAYKQQQHDIYGEMMDAIYIYNRYEAISYDLWRNLRRLLEWLEVHWQEPDAGIWEVRGGPKNFVHSRLMCWVAFDRALRLVRHRGVPAPMVDWMRTSAQIYEEIMEKGWNPKMQSFVQYYGSDAVDASALLMVLTRFAGPTDPRMLHTIERIQKELASDSLVHRYNPQKGADDGLGSTEGTFSACSFWLAESLARAGRLDESRLMLEKMLTYSNHVGLYAEEIGLTGEALGNYPQAFTHLSLITACYNIDQALNRSKGIALSTYETLHG